jgi:hypothetical protein
MRQLGREAAPLRQQLRDTLDVLANSPELPRTPGRSLA